MLKMANNKINPNTILIIVGIVVILLVVSKLDIIPGFSILPDDAPTGTCSISLNKLTLQARETITGTIQDGPSATCILYVRLAGTTWTSLGTFQLDFSGHYSHTEPVNTAGSYEVLAICTDDEGTSCKTNTETFTVTPGATSPPPTDPDEPDEGWEVGDIIDTSNGGSGELGWGDNILTEGITIDGWVPGGPLIPGVRIHRSWSYRDPQDPDCYEGFPEVVEWTFFDSNGMRWQVYDEVPTTTVEDICPVAYHPDSLWKFDVRNSKFGCVIDYSWSLEIYICEGGD